MNELDYLTEICQRQSRLWAERSHDLEAPRARWEAISELWDALGKLATVAMRANNVEVAPAVRRLAEHLYRLPDNPQKS